MSLLANLPRIGRLAGMMNGWWRGDSMAAIGREHGVSRQRVARILARVGSTGRASHLADRWHLDSPRRASAEAIAEAAAALHHPLAHALTDRQRGTLAWRAQGLVLADIALRMRTTPDHVCHLLAVAGLRLARLSAAATAAKARRKASDPNDDGIPRLDWESLTLGFGELGNE